MPGSASAHHNMSAVFDFSDRVTLTGTLTKIDWRNPHIELIVDAKIDVHQVQTWSIEGPPPRKTIERENPSCVGCICPLPYSCSQ